LEKKSQFESAISENPVFIGGIFL